MKICLINPSQKQERLGNFGKFAPAIPPTGIAYIASNLIQNGFEVIIIDQHARKWDNKRLLREIESIKPDIVGFSVLTFVMDSVEELSLKIRVLFPRIKIVLGNLHPTIFHKELIEEDIADFVVRGEGDQTMLSLCKAIRDKGDLHSIRGITFKEKGRLCVNPERPPISDLDSLPYPKWDLISGIKYNAFSVRMFEDNKFPVPMLASRGCLFNCKFCSQNIIYRGLRKRNLINVVDEIEYHNTQNGHTVFGFIDANFPPEVAYGHNFSNEVIKRGLNRRIKWFSEARPDLLDRDLLGHMYSAGLRLIQFGVESGNNAVLKIMNKLLSREKAINAFKWAKESGLITVGLFVIGMPEETREQIEDTLAFARQLKPDLVKFSIATPYPGSALWEQYKEFLKEEPTWKYSGWFDMTTHNDKDLLRGHRLDFKELIYLQKKGMFLFYAQPSIIKRLLFDGIVHPIVMLQGFSTFLKSIFEITINFIGRIARSEKGIPASAN